MGYLYEFYQVLYNFIIVFYTKGLEFFKNTIYPTFLALRFLAYNS